MPTTLVARLDSDGDVLLAGPVVRSVAASGNRVVLLAGSHGRQAAGLLPGVDDVLVWDCPWVLASPGPVQPSSVLDAVRRIAALGVDDALILTSYHQSPLPTALVLRLAGVPRIAATTEDYPGALLDVRHRGLPETGLHEVERMLALAAAAGYRLPPGDDGRLRVTAPVHQDFGLPGGYVVLHPGASVPARMPSPARSRSFAAALTAAGVPVAVTGGPSERELTAAVSHGLPSAYDLGGRTSLAVLAGVLARARAAVVPNTGPAHLAAAVGTPVVSLFAPVVPAERWRPYGVPLVLLGDRTTPCRATRARDCPVPGHPCLDSISPDAVVQAVMTLTAGPPKSDRRTNQPVAARRQPTGPAAAAATRAGAG